MMTALGSTDACPGERQDQTQGQSIFVDCFFSLTALQP